MTARILYSNMGLLPDSHATSSRESECNFIIVDLFVEPSSDNNFTNKNYKLRNIFIT